MTEELMIGTIGWDHENWVGDFYPDDLPADWRFAYYSNDYRAVLATADHFKTFDNKTVSDWVEDCDETFGFIVEIPRSILDKTDIDSLQTFLGEISLLRSRTRGFLLSLGETTSQVAAQLQPRIELLQEFGPVCIDFKSESETPDQLMQLMAAYHVGLCWHPDTNEAPRAGGSLMLALSDEQDPQGQRKIIEALEEWMQHGDGLAGLFLDSTAAASQARIIAEMLGV
ncbi:MAG: DUF72 domain-containing protein [Acidiferrobacterales bacterium]